MIYVRDPRAHFFYRFALLTPENNCTRVLDFHMIFREKERKKIIVFTIVGAVHRAVSACNINVIIVYSYEKKIFDMCLNCSIFLQITINFFVSFTLKSCVASV